MGQGITASVASPRIKSIITMKPNGGNFLDIRKIESHAIPRGALLFMAAVEEARKSTKGSIRAIAPIFRQLYT